MFAFGNLQMENLQNQNASSTGTTLKSTNAPASNTNQHQLLQDPPWIVKVNNFKSLHLEKEMLMIKKSHKFGIILQNLMVILQPLELNIIIVEMIMHVILLLMRQVICEVI
jgi:hypothetical protein